jgi:hypothetical protein
VSDSQSLAQPDCGLLDVSLIDPGSKWIRVTNDLQFIDEIITVTAVTTARTNQSMVFVQYSINEQQAGTFTGKESAWRKSFRPARSL